jgi:phosphate transport system permease protein
MLLSYLPLLIIALFGVGAFYASRARISAAPQRALPGLPGHYGWYGTLWTVVPAALVYAVWTIIDDQVIRNIVLSDFPELSGAAATLLYVSIENAAAGVMTDDVPMASVELLLNLENLSAAARFALVTAVSVLGFFWGWRRIRPELTARDRVETALLVALFIASIIAILTTVGIVLSLVVETFRFFQLVSPFEFFFGLEWSPQIALREDQVAASGAFGAVPVFAGTLLITVIAMLVAGPIGLMSAIYLAEYAHPRVRAVIKPLLEILAGIPTVVYGFFAALVLAPSMRNLGVDLGLTISSESALAAGLIMGIMIIPFVSSLSDDIMTAVPMSLREGSYGLGATASETIKRVILPAATPGIVGGFMLAISRAIGETMIVVMAAGLAANLTANPFEAVTTVTVQIATLLVGDHEFDSEKTMAAFALGLTLFFVTLALNVVALRVVQKYSERYE